MSEDYAAFNLAREGELLNDIGRLTKERAALVEALEDLCAQLGECGMTERARAALRAAGVKL